jgi:glyoxylase-like metal-dependent hydrolase (beta-lactamase superfamily II)
MTKATTLALGVIVALTIAAPSARGQDPIRTGDITVRRLTAADFPRITKLAPNVYGYEQIDPTKRTVTVNNLIVITSDGVLVAEGQGTVEHVKRLVDDIASLTPQPIKYVVVGSEHGDHTGGDAAFPESVTYFAQAYSVPHLKFHAETVADKKVITMGGTEIDILFLGRAHTGGDLEVYLPREKILFMSEVFSNRIFPSMANGYPTEWVQTLKTAEAMDASVYVPAHGFIDSAAVLREEERNYRLALEQIIAEGTRLYGRRTPIESATASANFGVYDNWTRAANNAYGALNRVYMELDGRLK